MSFLDEIDFCIKAYKRPKALERLRQSIKRFYPEAHITVNVDPCIAAGRNEMVAVTKRPFLLFLDDDFELTEETQIDRLFFPLRNTPSLGIVGGMVMDWINGERVPRNSGGYLTIENGVMRLDRAPHGLVDVVPNFFIAKRSVFDHCRFRWGIGAEHADFFMQVKNSGWLVLQEPVPIDHHPFSEALPGYKAARWNTGENILRFMEFWGIDSVCVNGRVVHSSPMGVTR